MDIVIVIFVKKQKLNQSRNISITEIITATKKVTEKIKERKNTVLTFIT